MDMLGFDYFRLLDLLTIARSRKHIEKYYGTSETGTFPSASAHQRQGRRRPGPVPPIVDINTEIRRLNLAVYAPAALRAAGSAAEYDAAKYSDAIRGGESIFRQVDREESLIHLMRVNLLKRMESSVHAFALTVERQLADVNGLRCQARRATATRSKSFPTSRTSRSTTRPSNRCWSAAR